MPALFEFFEAAKGHPQELKRLIESGADVHLHYEDGTTPLISISRNDDYIECLRILLEAGVNPNVVIEKGYSAIVVAMLELCSENIKLLLEYGADPLLSWEDEGEILQYFSDRNAPEIYAIFQSHFVKKEQEQLLKPFVGGDLKRQDKGHL